MPLNLHTLQSLVETELPDLHYIGFDSLPSTNAYLYSEYKGYMPAVCITSCQSAGYGQRGRSWLSNEDSLTFSLDLKSSVRLKDNSNLALYIGLRLCALINVICNEAVSLKWPNDLYVGNKKVAGLLIETKVDSSQSIRFVIGLGLNLSSVLIDEHDNNLINNPGFVSSSLSNEELALSLIGCIKQAMNDYQQVEAGQWIDLFAKYDHFENDEEVIVYHNDQTIKGRYAGISETGELLVLQDGYIHRYISAATSIRALNHE